MALPVPLRKSRRRKSRRGELARRDRAVERRDSSPSAGWPWAEFGVLHDEISQLQDRMERLFSSAFGDAFGEALGDLADRDDRVAGWRPAADVEETGDAYLVELELPGVKREDISVELGGGELVISGEVTERERVGLLRSRTRRVGRFHYRVSLPAEVKEDEVTASLADGVLTVRVPKTERARQRKIPVKPS